MLGALKQLSGAPSIYRSVRKIVRGEIGSLRFEQFKTVM
jgi:hypothetical protein